MLYQRRTTSFILALSAFLYLVHCINAIPLRNNAKRQPSFADHHNDLLQMNPLEDVVDPATATGGDQSMEVFAQELRKAIMDAKTKQAAIHDDDADDVDVDDDDDNNNDDDKFDESTTEEKVTYEEETEKESIEDGDLPVVVQGLEKMVGVDI